MPDGDPCRALRAGLLFAYRTTHVACQRCCSLFRQLSAGEEPVDWFCWRVFYPWLKERKMEALLFAYTAAATMPAAALASIFQEQACRRSLAYTEDVCKQLSDHEEQRYSVYVVTRRYLLLSEGLLTLASAVVAILAGPVCDKYGQRTLLGLAIAGAVGTSIFRVVLALGGGPMLSHVIAVLPMGLTGGHILVMACCYFVVTKRTEAKLFRTIRFYLLDVSALIGRAVGWLIGWLLHSVLGHQAALWAALGVQCFLLAILWASPVFGDSSLSATSRVNQLKTLVSAANAREAAKMFGGHREISRTLKLLFAMQALIATMNYGPDEILYPYTRLVYHWTYSYFAIVSAVGSLAVGVLGVFAVGCMRVVGVTDVTFMNIGATFGSARNLLIGLARLPAIFYLSYILAVPQGVGPVGVKSYFSKLVPVDETGKFMALVTACESVFTVLSRVVLSFSFDAASSIFAGLPFVLCALLLFPVSLLSGFLRPMVDATSSTSSAPAPPGEQGADAGGPAAGQGPDSVAVPADGVERPKPWAQLAGLAAPMAAQAIPILAQPVANAAAAILQPTPARPPAPRMAPPAPRVAPTARA